ncbi:hypothetical protein [Roseburia inulinivorans]
MHIFVDADACPWCKIARGDIDSYIDANYVRESHRKEYPVRSRSNARMRGLTEERE